MRQPCVIIIAGPNGAGKTTFAREYLPREAFCPVFINADLIAAGLSPFAPEKAAISAGRLMLREISAHVARRESFAFETTLAGIGYARQIPIWREAGYRVELIFLGLPIVEYSIARVAERVRHGGHSIPESTIRRRFVSGRRLFSSVYRTLVDEWTLYDNSGDLPVILESSSSASGDSMSAREPSSPYDISTDADAFVRGSMAALRRAAERARVIAEQTGTDLIVMRNGEMVRIKPQAQTRAPVEPQTQ
jgi:predicted ABC-type ATPase